MDLTMQRTTTPPRLEAQKKKYRVKAVWKTLQGEGCFAGRPAVFARFVGCNMWTGEEADRARDAARTGAGCPAWCDTDFRKAGSRAYTAAALAAEMAAVGEGVRFCVLTGGEPLLQVDAALVGALHAEGFQVAVETNGTVALADACRDAATGAAVAPDWIVCSPKLPEAQLRLETFDELKLVLPDYRPDAYAAFARRQRVHTAGGHRLPLLWLQPEDGPRLADATRLAVRLALDNPAWRVSVQTHKVLGVE